MKDRIPTYPGRVLMTPVEGQANTYDMAMADDPIELGTPLNKANILDDATTEAIFGNTDNKTPNDVFAVFPQLTNWTWVRQGVNIGVTSELVDIAIGTSMYGEYTQSAFTFNSLLTIIDPTTKSFVSRGVSADEPTAVPGVWFFAQDPDSSREIISTSVTRSKYVYVTTESSEIDSITPDPYFVTTVFMTNCIRYKLATVFKSGGGILPYPFKNEYKQLQDNTFDDFLSNLSVIGSSLKFISSSIYERIGSPKKITHRFGSGDYLSQDPDTIQINLDFKPKEITMYSKTTGSVYTVILDEHEGYDIYKHGVSGASVFSDIFVFPYNDGLGGSACMLILAKAEGFDDLTDMQFTYNQFIIDTYYTDMYDK